MKNLLFMYLTLTISIGYTQSIKTLEERKKQFSVAIESYNDSIEAIDFKIKAIKLEKARESTTKEGIKGIVTYKTYIAEEVNGTFNVLGYLNPGDSVIIQSVKNEKYFVTAGAIKGYVYGAAVKSDADAEHIYNENTKKTKQWRTNSNYESSKPKTNTRSRPNVNRTIHTGPRGGRYYINKNGNKTYIKH